MCRLWRHVLLAVIGHGVLMIMSPDLASVQYVLQEPHNHSQPDVPHTKLLPEVNHAAESNIGANELLHNIMC